MHVHESTFTFNRLSFTAAATRAPQGRSPRQPEQSQKKKTFLKIPEDIVAEGGDEGNPTKSQYEKI